MPKPSKPSKSTEAVYIDAKLLRRVDRLAARFEKEGIGPVKPTRSVILHQLLEKGLNRMSSWPYSGVV
jgi:hypothetical protein